MRVLAYTLIIALISWTTFYFKLHIQPIAIVGNIILTTAILSIIYIACSILEEKRVSDLFVKLILFITQFFFIFFFISTIISNLFWGQTITKEIVVFYLQNIRTLSSAIHIDLYILTSISIITLLVDVYIFRILSVRKPYFSFNLSRIKSKLRPILGISLSLVLLCISYKSRELKRYFHIKGEPLLEFFLGPIWTNSSWQTIIDNQLTYGSKLESCTTLVNKETNSNLKNIYLIVADGLTSKHMSSYGYDRKQHLL